MLNAMTLESPNKPLFDAVLTPHRSLSPWGFWLIMGAVVLLSFAAGIGFLLQGAWPVLGFFGLDVLLIYWAFRASFRSGRTQETVRLTRDQLVVRRINPGGDTRTWTFKPHWLSVTVEEPESHFCRLAIADRERKIWLGTFLAPEERLALADALKAALRDARGPA